MGLVLYLLSTVQVHTTTHCRFYKEQQCGPPPPKAGTVTNVGIPFIFVFDGSVSENEMKNKKYHNVEKFPKCNRNTCIVDRGTLDTTNPQIHDRSLSLLGTDRLN